MKLYGPSYWDRMSLQGILEDIKQAPTMMSIEEEMHFMVRLIQIPTIEIHEKFKDFYSIMRELKLSHMEAFFDVTDENYPFLCCFADWLMKLKFTSQSKDKRTYFKDLSDLFREDGRKIWIEKAD